MAMENPWPWIERLCNHRQHGVHIFHEDALHLEANGDVVSSRLVTNAYGVTYNRIMEVVHFTSSTANDTEYVL